MTTKQILAELYTMALQAAGLAALLGQGQVYDYAIANDGVRVNVFVAASSVTTGTIVLICGNERYETTDIDTAAIVLHNAIQ